MLTPILAYAGRQRPAPPNKLPQVAGEPPSPRNAASAAAVGSRLYMFGGRTGVDMGEGSLSDLWVFDIEAIEWSRVEPAGGVAPPARSYHASCAQVSAGQGRIAVHGSIAPCGMASAGSTVPLCTGKVQGWGNYHSMFN